MKTALIIVGILIASALTYFGFYSAFYSPKVAIQDEGNEIFVFKHEKGAYHLADSVMRVVFNELYEKNGIVVTKGFGYYYQNPFKAKNTPIEFDAGCIVNDEDSLQLSRISGEFIIQRTPKSSYIVSDFPLKGRTSILFGSYKVYPKIDQFCIENGYAVDVPVMEIYNRKEKKIHYRRKLVENIQPIH